MRFVTFTVANESPRAGVLAGGEVIDLSAVFSDVLSIVTSGTDALATAAQHTGARLPLDSVRLFAPLTPPRIFCVGLNYRDHAVESNMEIPKVPTVFLKLPSALTGHGSAIQLPGNSTQVDYEAEFAAVIGSGGHNIAKEDWHRYIFGYTILNDVSARDIQLATSQWSLGKSFDTFCPLGPAIVTKDEVADPHQLQVRLSIDGEVLQNSNTRELIFKLPELLAYISSITPLLPGDIISTGTPAGVGLGRKPQRWLKSGETVTIDIDGLGTLVNPIS